MSLEPRFVDRVAHSVFNLSPGQYRLALGERTADAVITNIVGVLSREVVRREPGGRLYAESLANILAVHLLRNYAQCPDGKLLEACSQPEEATLAAKDERAGRGGSHPRAVAEAVRFIQDNYARDVSLNDIAEAVHLSPFHVARLFKQALGISPHQYLIQVRVHSARSLLLAGSGGRSLAEVATAVGFADQSHLTRHFKRLLGLTPKQLRAWNTSGDSQARLRRWPLAAPPAVRYASAQEGGVPALGAWAFKRSPGARGPRRGPRE